MLALALFRWTVELPIFFVLRLIVGEDTALRVWQAWRAVFGLVALLILAGVIVVGIADAV